MKVFTIIVISSSANTLLPVNASDSALYIMRAGLSCQVTARNGSDMIPRERSTANRSKASPPGTFNSEEEPLLLRRSSRGSRSQSNSPTRTSSLRSNPPISNTNTLRQTSPNPLIPNSQRIQRSATVPLNNLNYAGETNADPIPRQRPVPAPDNTITTNSARTPIRGPSRSQSPRNNIEERNQSPTRNTRSNTQAMNQGRMPSGPRKSRSEASQRRLGPGLRRSRSTGSETRLDLKPLFPMPQASVLVQGPGNYIIHDNSIGYTEGTVGAAAGDVRASRHREGVSTAGQTYNHGRVSAEATREQSTINVQTSPGSTGTVFLSGPGHAYGSIVAPGYTQSTNFNIPRSGVMDVPPSSWTTAVITNHGRGRGAVSVTGDVRGTGTVTASGRNRPSSEERSRS